MDSKVARVIATTALCATLLFLFIAPTVSSSIANQADTTDNQGDSIYSNHSASLPLLKIIPLLLSSKIMLGVMVEIAAVLLFLQNVRGPKLNLRLGTARAPPLFLKDGLCII